MEALRLLSVACLHLGDLRFGLLVQVTHLYAYKSSTPWTKRMSEYYRA